MKFIKNRFLKIHFSFLFCLLSGTSLIGQDKLTVRNPNGLYELSTQGASYFAKLSLNCAGRTSPHFYERYKEHYGVVDSTSSKDIWPSFYGCYDWHSSVHNHWCMIKLLKTHPEIPEAKEIVERLNFAFSKENIAYELYFLNQNEEGYFEFPYGQSWFLKIGDELKRWNSPLAKKWLVQIEPVLTFIEENHLKYWPNTPFVKISGSHDSPAMGLSFALDYARSFGKRKLEKEIITASKKYYSKLENAPIELEPVEYDFMSGCLLIADLMRKVLSKKEYTIWLSKFAPELFDEKQVDEALKINKIEVHDGFESHWDGFHLNRIWCLNGMLISLPKNALSETVRNKWHTAMNEMWDYAQLSIGKGNYDIDHWLSSFSVFALSGYK